MLPLQNIQNQNQNNNEANPVQENYVENNVNVEAAEHVPLFGSAVVEQAFGSALTCLVIVIILYLLPSTYRRIKRCLCRLSESRQHRSHRSHRHRRHSVSSSARYEHGDRVDSPALSPSSHSSSGSAEPGAAEFAAGAIPMLDMSAAADRKSDGIAPPSFAPSTTVLGASGELSPSDSPSAAAASSSSSGSSYDAGESDPVRARDHDDASTGIANLGLENRDSHADIPPPILAQEYDESDKCRPPVAATPTTTAVQTIRERHCCYRIPVPIRRVLILTVVSILVFCLVYHFNTDLMGVNVMRWFFPSGEATIAEILLAVGSSGSTVWSIYVYWPYILAAVGFLWVVVGWLFPYFDRQNQ